MTAAELLHEIHADGLQLALTETGNIRVKGETDQIQKWTPAIRQHKPALVEVLQSWAELEAAVNACCHARHDTDEQREAILDDCWREPATAWAWLTWYFKQDAAKWTH